MAWKVIAIAPGTGLSHFRRVYLGCEVLSDVPAALLQVVHALATAQLRDGYQCPIVLGRAGGLVEGRTRYHAGSDRSESRKSITVKALGAVAQLVER